MPERLSRRRIVCDEVTAAVVAEQQSAGRAEQTHRAAGAARRGHRERMAPADLARLVVDGLQRAADVAGVSLGGGPSLRARVRVGEIQDAERLRRAEIQKSRVGIETRRRPVGRAARVRRDQRARHARVLLGVSNGLPLRVDLFRPVRRVEELRREDVLAVGAIEQHVVAVAVRLRDELARTAVDHAVDEHRRLRGVPVVRVVRRHLVAPHHLAGVRIERDDRAGPEVVAFAALPGEHGIRIAGADVVEIQFRIVGAGQPRHAAAVRHRIFVGPRLGARLAFARRRVETPHDFSALGIARLEIAGHVERVAADADDHLLADDDRRVGREVLALHAGDFLVPALLAGRRVEGDEIVVGRQEVQPLLVDADAAVADVIAAARFPEVVPDLTSRARIDGPHMIGRRQIQHSVDEQRRRLDGRRRPAAGSRFRPFAADDRAVRARVQSEHPRERQGLHVRGVDLLQRAVAAAGEVAVIRRPRIGRRLRTKKSHRGERKERREYFSLHFRPIR